MPNLGSPFPILAAFRDAGGRSASRARLRRQPVLEPVEGRLLLSGVHAASLATTKIAQADHLHQRPHAGPVLNIIGVGYAVKQPRFYEEYAGQLRAELNAAGMKATYDAQGNLVLTGIVAGPITNTPAPDASAEYYVFGVSHNAGGSVSPFPGRPNIKYDAIVAVGFTAEGVSGYVLDTATNTFTPLTQDNILNQGEDVKVFVPAGTPGIGLNADGTNPSAVFWTQDTAPSLNPNPQDIASFAPEGRDVLIAGAPGRPAPPHLL